MRSLSLTLLACLLLTAAATAGPNYAPGSLDRDFTLEWRAVPDARCPRLEGYVYNHAHMLADRMRLSIEVLDASGQVVDTTATWVMGGVPPDSRAWFTAPVPPGAGYRVEILSFDWIGRGGGGQ